MNYVDPCCPNRRELLKLGLGGSLAFALAGSELFAQDERERPRGGGAAQHCIILYMAGGMSQTDTFDPKPKSKNAGPLGAIKTAAKGLVLSELLPGLADQAKHLAVIRSMATREGAHDRARYLLHTGYAPSGTVRHPDLGALVSQATFDPKRDLPAYVAIAGSTIGAGILGVDHAPFSVTDPSRPVDNLAYAKGVDGKRFGKRRKLLEAIERRFRGQHPGDETDGHSRIYEKADRVMHSPKVGAFDVSDEPRALRDAYGNNRFGQGCLMARRLIEQGVRVVEVQLGGWDTHQDNFTANRRNAAILDSGFATLLDDLKTRDLLGKTLVLCMTEFGRTPRINANDGRDHWAMGWSVALAGGGIRGGQGIGATNGDGTKVAERPIGAQDLHASVFHAMGLDAGRINETPNGRPIRAVDEAGIVIPELFV
jgi:uncharacterized protein (DUF1501 family)